MSHTRRVEKRILPSGLVTYRAPYIDSAGVRRSKQFPTAKEAKQFLLTVGGELRLGVHTPSSLSPTIGEAAAMWIARCERDRLEPMTVTNYREHVNLHIAPFIGDVKLAALTTPMVKAFSNRLHEAGRSADMIRRVVASLGAIFKEAREHGLVATAPTVGVNRKKSDRDNPRPEIPSKNELVAIIAAATERGPRWRAFFLVAVFCGLRASELRGLRWEDIDLVRHEIHVTQRADARGRLGRLKSKSAYRSIPISVEVVQALREWKLMCPSSVAGLVFPNARGKVASYLSVIETGFTPIQIAAGVTVRQDGELVTKFGLHSLRHATASLWIEEGLNPKRVQNLMGHHSIQLTFDTYGHLFKDKEADARAAARVHSALLGG